MVALYWILVSVILVGTIAYSAVMALRADADGQADDGGFETPGVAGRTAQLTSPFWTPDYADR